MRKHPERLFIDAKCTQPFPLALPPIQSARFHRIVVALNAAQRCKEYFGNTGSGSLMLRTDISGEAHYFNPFTIGQIAQDRGYIHVLDDVTLNIILRELDTITDFTDYLTRKEAALQSGRLVVAAGEEEILAHYLTELNSEEKHDVILPGDAEGVYFTEGSWASIAKHPRYVTKKKADKQSYAWDELIEQFIKHITSGTLETGNEHPLSHHEQGVRMLAGEGRLSRRILTHSLFDLLSHADERHPSTRLVLSLQDPERAFQFIVCPQWPNEAYGTYRERRKALLAAYCHVAKVHRPELLDIVGIATEPPNVSPRSEDLVYLNARHWTEEDERTTRELQARTGILTRARERRFRGNEYPELRSTGIGRTLPSLNRKQRRANKAKARGAKTKK